MWGLFYKYEEEEAQRRAMQQGRPCPHGNVKGLVLKDPKHEDLNRLLRRELPEDIIKAKFENPAQRVTAQKDMDMDTDMFFFGIQPTTDKSEKTSDDRSFLQYVLEEYPRVVANGLKGKDIIDTIKVYKREYNRERAENETLKERVAQLEKQLDLAKLRNTVTEKTESASHKQKQFEPVNTVPIREEQVFSARNTVSDQGKENVNPKSVVPKAIMREPQSQKSPTISQASEIAPIAAAVPISQHANGNTPLNVSFNEQGEARVNVHVVLESQGGEFKTIATPKPVEIATLKPVETANPKSLPADGCKVCGESMRPALNAGHGHASCTSKEPSELPDCIKSLKNGKQVPNSWFSLNENDLGQTYTSY
ncbi:unnamed protein product [Kuraishia capsulata CBS 1993]|uniref:Uncharacterized protein n=1 Tax=Kuraishia capsulata CBS 1993 TaxID=1382522 RepID=W6MTZ9_9ASCO|nr:uncharacterized protein KUCA_T00001314001 [Kuraishia capsulata CBS 1993]CDK25345.1 unnamed protein product [Kuraishia capsulata CBS 1993]